MSDEKCMYQWNPGARPWRTNCVLTVEHEGTKHVDQLGRTYDTETATTGQEDPPT